MRKDSRGWSLLYRQRSRLSQGQKPKLVQFNLAHQRRQQHLAPTCISNDKSSETVNFEMLVINDCDRSILKAKTAANVPCWFAVAGIEYIQSTHTCILTSSTISRSTFVQIPHQCTTNPVFKPNRGRLGGKFSLSIFPMHYLRCSFPNPKSRTKLPIRNVTLAIHFQ